MSDLNPNVSEGASANDKNTAKPETIPASEPQARPTDAVEINQQEKSAIEAAKAASEAKATQKETLDAVKKSERIALVIAGIVAVATIGQWVTSCNNNASTSIQTDKLICAANKNAEAADKIRVASERNAAAAEGFATSAGNINVAMGDAVKKLNLQAGALNESVIQATRLAHDTEVANQNASDADRPWFGAQIVITDFDPDHVPMATCTFTNSGRRPAKVEQARCTAEILQKFPPEPNNGEVQLSSRAFVVPGANFSSKISMVNERMYYGVVKDGKYTKALFDSLNQGATNFFVYGKVDYTDVRDSKTHFTHACVQYVPATSFTPAGFATCNVYNDAK
jgi:hypothetical protein